LYSSKYIDVLQWRTDTCAQSWKCKCTRLKTSTVLMVMFFLFLSLLLLCIYVTYVNRIYTSNQLGSKIFRLLKLYKRKIRFVMQPV
jgi:hypothetical protein